MQGEASHISHLPCEWSSHLPVFKSTDHLLDEDDFVCDGLVSLNLQQHVVVVLWEVATKHPCLKLSICLTNGRRGGMRPFPGGNV